MAKIPGLFIIQDTYLGQDNNFFYLMFNPGCLFGPGQLFFLSKVQFRTLIWPRRLFGTEEYMSLTKMCSVVTVIQGQQAKGKVK